MKWVHIFLDLIFPENCLSCGTQGSAICDTCVQKLRLCERKPAHSIRALYDYRDPIVRKMIWSLKYYHRKSLSVIMGNALYESYAEDIADIKFFAGARSVLVIPVPLSRKKIRHRGYNQTALIASSLCASVPESNILAYCPDVVYKHIDTDPQARITQKSKRKRNVEGVFSVRNEALVAGRTCIVIDDVTTTGATLKEIAKVLKTSGAKKILCIACAH